MKKLKKINNMLLIILKSYIILIFLAFIATFVSNRFTLSYRILSDYIFICGGIVVTIGLFYYLIKWAEFKKLIKDTTKGINISYNMLPAKRVLFINTTIFVLSIVTSLILSFLID